MSARSALMLRRCLAWTLALAGLCRLALFGRHSTPEVGPDPLSDIAGQKLLSISCQVDATERLGEISPLIYGIAQPSPGLVEALHLPLTRWGGNPATRYNWEKGNCWNAASDYQFRNGDYGANKPDDRLPSGVADKAILSGRAHHMEMLLTIPTMGWVARDDNTAHRSVGVPTKSGDPVSPGSDAIAGYDPTENRKRVSQRSLPRKGKPFSDPPDLTDDVVYQDEWVLHLVHKFGDAREGGVRFYAMDNEPDLWDRTHVDMHPVRPDYEELLRRFLDYATAVKDVDPSAQITGPVSWGWSGYFFSPRDRGNDNYRTHADRRAHGGMAFLPWFLSQVAAHDRKTGRRTLDILDVHYYPQESKVYSAADDPATRALRLRSVRSLWDTTYRDESWIGEVVALIPRLRQWVNRYYPGTKIGITEWNWGAEKSPDGGLAVADVLGILGRERVDLAVYWASPPAGSPAFLAYKMYRDADGTGGFGDVAVKAESSVPPLVSCYGSLETKTGHLAVMIVNKTDRSTKANITLKAPGALRVAEVFSVGGGQWKTISALPETPIRNGMLEIEVAPASITLLRCR